MEKYYKYALFFFFAITLYISYLIVKPYLISIISAVILGYIFYPLYKKLNLKIKNNTLSSLITIFLILILIITPVVFFANIIIKETISFYKSGELTNAISFIKNYTENIELIEYTRDIIKSLTKSLISDISAIIIKLPSTILHIFLMILVMFFLFKDGEKLVKEIESSTPLKNHHKEKLINQFHIVTKAVIYGSFVTAIIQGILSTIIFYILQVPNPFLLGLATTVLAIIPIGATAIWLPVSIYLILTSNILKGIILIILGIAIISSVDNFIKPWILHKKAKVHALTAVIGLLGGIKLFGFIGIVLGPLILSFLFTFLNIYGAENETKN